SGSALRREDPAARPSSRAAPASRAARPAPTTTVTSWAPTRSECCDRQAGHASRNAVHLGDGADLLSWGAERTDAGPVLRRVLPNGSGGRGRGRPGLGNSGLGAWGSA